MTNLPFIKSAGKKLVATAVLCGLISIMRSEITPIVPASMISASEATTGMHSASSEQKLASPIHKAPTLLPVVDQKDIEPEHRELAHAVLLALPTQCKNHLQNFYVNYKAGPNNRGLGGANSIIIAGNVPKSEFIALLIHECGHVTDLGGLEGHSESGKTAYYDGSQAIYADDPSIQFYSISWETAKKKKSSAKSADFISGYGTSDMFEDFAETFAFYALHQKEFARLAKNNPILLKKYQFMHNVVFTDTKEFAMSSYKRSANLPWDVTKLPFIWHAKQ